MWTDQSYAVFRAEFPDDSVEESSEIVVPAGRNIMDAIRQRVDSTGATTTESIQHSFYGWTAEFQIGKVTIWMLLQHDSQWLLIVEARASWLTGARAREVALKQGIAIVGEALRAESRIKDPRWMTKEEFAASKRRA
jgi:hypothetical protein